MADDHDSSASSAQPHPSGWTGEDVTVGGGSATPVARKIPVEEESSSGRLGWTGEDATLGGGSQPLTPRPPSHRQSPLPEPCEESSSVLPAWSGEDATLGGGSPITPRPPSAWTGEDGTGVWTGSDATVAGRSAASSAQPDQTRWLAQQAAAQKSATWMDDEVALTGGAGTSERAASAVPVDQWGAHTPIHTGATPAKAPASNRQSKASSGRLRQINDVDRQRMLAGLRGKDAAWLDDGRSGELSGRTLGDFLVGAILGEGGMGVVYRARQISLDRRVALKVLPPALAADPVLMERFASEAHTAGLLVSPNVVQVYFAGNVDDQVFFAMEFVAGTDLAHVIAEHRSTSTVMPAEQAGRYIAQAARGLAEAERHHVVHRDIKPQNLLMTGDDVVKIADFGIAKVAGEHHLTLTGSALGTPAYCSPEQGRGDQVDQRSDLYALGVVFYELLIGQKPFVGTQGDQLIYQHNYAEPKPPRSLRPNLPEAYETVCMRLLMKDPDQRYQHAADLAQDLEVLITGGRVQAPPFEIRFGTGAQVAMRKHLGRRRWIPWIIGATVAVGAGVVLWLGNQALDADEMARRRSALASLDRVASVPRSALADVSWLSERLGTTDRDVQRWQAKLLRLETLRSRLTRLDAEIALPEVELRTASEIDLANWQAEVGSSDPDAQRWHGRIAAANDEIARLRVQLGELDRGDPLTVAQAKRLGPVVQRITSLAGAGDAEVKRWQVQLDRHAERLTAARTALVELVGTAPITELRLKMLRSEWRLYRSLVGDDDQDSVAWGRQLDQREDELKRLRETGTRLDRVDLATTTLQAEIGADLGRLASLVPTDDPQLSAWQAKIAVSRQRIDSLSRNLGGVLDAATHPDAPALASCQRQLAEYRALVSSDDGHLVAWERRMAAEYRDVADQQAVLVRLDQATPLTVAEQRVCQRALTELTQRKALGDERRAAYARRLSSEAERVATLRAVLIKAEEPGAGITSEVTTAATAFIAAASGDEIAVRWQARLAAYHRARELLAALDQIAPLPDDVTTQLTAYAALVPSDDGDLRRWQTKVARVRELNGLLSPLTRVEPPPPQSREWLTELAERLTGSSDAVVVNGRGKLERLARLDEVLAVLDQTLVLPVEVDLGAALSAWRDLVGANDLRWQKRELRFRQLSGPGRPSWASGYGRDAQGPWAELVVNGNHQRLRFIPGGTMRLGSPSDEIGRDRDEAPPHDVAVRSFWIADSECTQAMYAGMVYAWPAAYRAPDRPVENITRADALRWCVALSKTVAGAVARLPSEAEWEYACRAGSVEPFSGPDGALPLARLSEIAWFNRSDSPRPVGLLQANRFGLYDCHGNVWEWVADRYLSGDGRSSGDEGVVRGGSWADRALLLRAANRMALDPEKRSAMVGFRFAITAAWPDGREPGFTVADGSAPAK